MGGGGGGGRSDGCGSSSGDEDGDAEWRSAIDSVSATVHGSFYQNGFASDESKTKHLNCSNPCVGEGLNKEQKPPRLTHYQKKVQKHLFEMLEESLEIVRNPIDLMKNDPVENECKIRLFKHSPLGIVFDHVDEYQGPKKKPRILPGEEIDEKSKKFHCQIESIVVEGTDIIAAARDAQRKSMARLEAKDAAKKAAAQREEERVAALKKLRGERWPPSIAREMGKKSQSCK